MILKTPKFVCTLCGQGFTRNASGNRHNFNIHQMQSKIVLLVEYLVGRVSGIYLPADPSKYRKRKIDKFAYQRQKRGSLDTLRKREDNDIRKSHQLTDINRISHNRVDSLDIDFQLNELIEYLIDLYPAYSILNICQNIKIKQKLYGDQSAKELIDQVMEKACNLRLNNNFCKLQNKCPIKNNPHPVFFPPSQINPSIHNLRVLNNEGNKEKFRVGKDQFSKNLKDLGSYYSQNTLQKIYLFGKDWQIPSPPSDNLMTISPKNVEELYTIFKKCISELKNLDCK